ncbi:hypothetical protein NBRC3222_2709 [Acetobacter pasteurianus NBRC 3222]|nr:hypothetical protein NBRC3222_2709 [Acetobacter pasteurianus NBRC 3222]
MLTPVPFAFSLDLDPGAVDQEMKRSARATIGNIDCQGFLPPAQRAEIRYMPRQSSQAKQAFDETGRLPQGHAEENLQRQTGLDRGIAVTPSPSPPPR